MKRFLLILSTICLFGTNVHAKVDLSKVTFGLEWGYIATVHSGYHYNFFAPEGYRVDTYDNSFTYRSNADMYIHAGYNLSPVWNLSMYLGYEGIAGLHKAVPVSLRMTRFFEERGNGDRWFSFLDLGSGVCLKNPVQEILTGKIGGGYRISLSRSAALDFIISGRITYTHPSIIYEDTPIPMDRTNRNNVYASVLSVGISLSF